MRNDQVEILRRVSADSARRRCLMNCLLYARVSTDKQAQKALSIPAQLDAMRQHARREGWKIVGHFVDRGESAKTANRPELKRLILHCKEHKDVDLVVVHKIDRLARNTLDYATIKAVLKQKGIRLVSVSEPFEDNPIGHFLENIIASISEWYSANLGDEIRKANLAKLNQGEWPHRPPIGYKSIRGDRNRAQHIPDETTAPLVQQAFELFATGQYSLLTLSEEMFHRGLATQRGNRYSAENIKKLLSREFYIGRLRWRDQMYSGKHPPLVTPQLFHRVQDVLKRRGVDTGEKGRLEFLLRGMAYCRACGRRLSGEIHPRGSYYRCLPHIGQPRCAQPYTPVAHLDQQLERLYERLQPPPGFVELLRSEVRGMAQQRQHLARRERETHVNAVTEIEAKELRLLDEMLAGKVPRDVYDKLAHKYREKRQQAEARLAQLDVDYEDPLKFLDQCASIADTLGFLHRSFEFPQRKTLARAVFKRIVVSGRTIVGVELNPPFSLFFADTISSLFSRSAAADRATSAAGGNHVNHTSPAEPGKEVSMNVPEDQLQQLLAFSLSDDFENARQNIDNLPRAAVRAKFQDKTTVPMKKTNAMPPIVTPL